MREEWGGGSGDKRPHTNRKSQFLRPHAPGMRLLRASFGAAAGADGAVVRAAFCERPTAPRSPCPAAWWRLRVRIRTALVITADRHLAQGTCFSGTHTWWWCWERDQYFVVVVSFLYLRGSSRPACPAHLASTSSKCGLFGGPLGGLISWAVSPGRGGRARRLWMAKEKASAAGRGVVVNDMCSGARLLGPAPVNTG